MVARMAATGDNQGPSLLSLLDEALDGADLATIKQAFEVITDRLAADTPERQAKRGRLLGFVKMWDEQRPEIENEEQAGKATTLSAQLKRAMDAEEGARKAAKDPFLSGGRKIDGAFNGRHDKLADGRKGIDARLSRHLTKMENARRAREAEARKQQEEADRKAREAAEAAAKAEGDVEAKRRAEEAEAERQRAAQAAEAAQQKSQVRSDVGGMASGRKVYSVKVLGLHMVPREFMILDESAALTALKAGRIIPGLELVTEIKATVRG